MLIFFKLSFSADCLGGKMFYIISFSAFGCLTLSLEEIQVGRRNCDATFKYIHLRIYHRDFFYKFLDIIK